MKRKFQKALSVFSSYFRVEAAGPKARFIQIVRRTVSWNFATEGQ